MYINLAIDYVAKRAIIINCRVIIIRVVYTIVLVGLSLQNYIGHCDFIEFIEYYIYNCRVLYLRISIARDTILVVNY